MILFLSKKQIQNISECYKTLEQAEEAIKNAIELFHRQRDLINKLEAEKETLIEENKRLKNVLQLSAGNPYWIYRGYPEDIDFPNSTKGGS